MVLALDYTPQSATDGYPVPGTLVTLTATGAIGTSREFELMSTPNESTLSLARLTDASGAAIDTFTPDQPGEYVFTVYDYRDTGFAPARWAGDITAQRGKKLIDKATGTVYVGEEMDLPIVTTRGEGATLRLTIVNNTVRVATIVNPLSELSRVAALESTTDSARLALVGVAVSALGNDLVTTTAELVTKFEAHRLRTSTDVPPVHYTQDLVNAMERVYVGAIGANSITYAIAQLNEVADKIEKHTRSGSSSTRWHHADDTQYTRMVGAASDIASATVLLADVGYRVYNRHRSVTGIPDVHLGGDGINIMSTRAPLTTFLFMFLDAIAAIDPTTAAGESDGADDAAHMYGFRRAS